MADFEGQAGTRDLITGIIDIILQPRIIENRQIIDRPRTGALSRREAEYRLELLTRLREDLVLKVPN